MALGRGTTFKNSGFERNSFQFWQTKQEGDSGFFTVYKGSPSILSFFPDLGPRGGEVPTLRKPRRGKYAASSVQSGPGTRLLLRNIDLKPDTKRKLAFVLSYDNLAGEFSNPEPDSLHIASDPPRAYGAGGRSERGISGGNQQYRVDIIRKDADPYSIDDADVIKNLLKSKPGDDPSSGWHRYRFNVSSLPAGQAKLRVAEADENGNLLVGFDALKLAQTK